MQFFAVLLSTVALAVSTIATPLHVAERRQVAQIDVTSPTSSSVWEIGAEEQVCWVVDSSTPDGTIVYIRLVTPSTDVFLETDYPYSNGCADVTVPGVPSGYSNYVIVGEFSQGLANPPMGSSATFPIGTSG